jgi:hypothetical protein
MEIELPEDLILDESGGFAVADFLKQSDGKEILAAVAAAICNSEEHTNVVDTLAAEAKLLREKYPDSRARLNPWVGVSREVAI